MALRIQSSSVACLLAVLVVAAFVWGGPNQNNLFNNRAVGGISISPEGILNVPTAEDRKLLRNEVASHVGKAAVAMNQPVGLRMISLRGIAAAISESTDGELPDEVRYLAGLQRIQYVLLYPERNDIVLAGPGEGWKIDESGEVVGVTTGLPVIRLEDLAIALRTVGEARKGGITCSIDPTQEGIQKFQQVSAQATTVNPAVISALEKAMGPQKISVTGVADTTHFARVLVASDYRMKRYAMDLEKAPVPGLPSFVGMLKSKKALQNMLPRWWLACNYEPLAKSEDGLAWELRGPGVKVMTEDDFVENGKVQRTGKSSPVAEQWAQTLTEKYAALSVKDPVFGELRNLMDMCVIAALIEREGLADKVKLDLSSFLDEKGVRLREFHAPKEVSSRCSVTKSGRDWIITASGGVEINSWSVAENVKTDEAVSQIRDKALRQDAKAWWWN